MNLLRRYGLGWVVLTAVAAGCAAHSGRELSASDFANARKQMVERDLRGRGLRDERLLDAMGRVPRELFVPPRLRARAYDDSPLPIDREQTISQPFIVALMTEVLKLPPHARVLEVGTGSGYQAAVLAEMGAEVYSIEIIPELAEQARQRLAALGYDKVHVRAGDGYHGWPEEAPFDAVIITAAIPVVPLQLVRQLKEGGVMVFPQGSGPEQDLIRGRKGPVGLRMESLGAVRFVPMTGAVRGQ